MGLPVRSPRESNLRRVSQVHQHRAFLLQPSRQGMPLRSRVERTCETVHGRLIRPAPCVAMWLIDLDDARLQSDRRIYMSKINLLALAAALILAGVGGWIASSPHTTVAAPISSRTDALHMMTNAKDLPAVRYQDFSLVF